MDIKPLTSEQMTLIKAYKTWFIEKYSTSKCKLKVEHKDNDRLVEFSESCGHKSTVKN